MNRKLRRLIELMSAYHADTADRYRVGAEADEVLAAYHQGRADAFASLLT